MFIRFYKKLDVNNKICVPKAVKEKFGDEYYMEIYKDYIKLVPIKKEERK